jgi:hypothetical protein
LGFPSKLWDIKSDRRIFRSIFITALCSREPPSGAAWDIKGIKWEEINFRGSVNGKVRFRFSTKGEEVYCKP